MNITSLPLESELDTALGLLEDGGIDFTVVCSGPERECIDWRIPQAA